MKAHTLNHVLWKTMMYQGGLLDRGSVIDQSDTPCARSEQASVVLHFSWPRHTANFSLLAALAL